jgi:hypothetical protein
MIVTKDAVLPLFPKRVYATRIYAMCGQMHEGAPFIEATYKVGELADSGLVKLAKYLGENYIQNMIGQHAVWAYTDTADFEELKTYGADSLTIEMTRWILDSVGLVTKLNPKVINPPVTPEDTMEVSINKYYVYTGFGLLVLFSVTTVVLIYRSRKKSGVIS